MGERRRSERTCHRHREVAEVTLVRMGTNSHISEIKPSLLMSHTKYGVPNLLRPAQHRATLNFRMRGKPKKISIKLMARIVFDMGK